jgi:hypothetical protein
MTPPFVSVVKNSRSIPLFVNNTAAITARLYPFMDPADLERKRLIREMELGRFCLQGT